MCVSDSLFFCKSYAVALLMFGVNGLFFASALRPCSAKLQAQCTALGL